MPGRAEARRNNYLDQAVLPGSVVSTDLDRSSMPRTQKASPSSAPSLYPSVARCGETSDMQHTSLCRTGLVSPAVLHNVGEYEA